MVEGAFIVNDVDDVLPELDTLPVPVQPVQTYWIPDGPEAGDVTDEDTNEPPSNHPVSGVGEPYGDVTVR
jgi:hypothetical protein